MLQVIAGTFLMVITTLFLFLAAYMISHEDDKPEEHNKDNG